MGDVGHALLSDNSAQAKQLAQSWVALFPGRYYLELHRAGHAGDEGYVQRAVRLAGGLRLPVVATHPVQFLTREEFRAHEARVCISQGHILADQRRPRAFTPEQY